MMEEPTMWIAIVLGVLGVVAGILLLAQAK